MHSDKEPNRIYLPAFPTDQIDTILDIRRRVYFQPFRILKTEVRHLRFFDGAVPTNTNAELRDLIGRLIMKGTYEV